MKKIFSLSVIIFFALLFVSQPALAKQHKLRWPVSGEVLISFEDDNSPFKQYFVHSGIDLDADQGTAVKSAQKGTVVIARKPKDTSYSYVMITNKNGLSTVYGHLSKVKVKKGDKIKKGQVIGQSGGTPGTKGAGMYTTGAHLHFEVRQDGIPVDPMDYLKKRNK